MALGLPILLLLNVEQFGYEQRIKLLDKKENLDVDNAYSLETPADSIRLYEKWADTYDADFIGSVRTGFQRLMGGTSWA